MSVHLTGGRRCRFPTAEGLCGRSDFHIHRRGAESAPGPGGKGAAGRSHADSTGGVGAAEEEQGPPSTDSRSTRRAVDDPSGRQQLTLPGL